MMVASEGTIMADCLFCKIAAGEIPSRQVFADERFYAFEDINPQAPTHFLIVPRRHIPTLDDLSREDGALVGDLVLLASQLAREKGLAESGYRLNINCREGAGQTVFHLHAHVLGGREFRWPPG
jgi:histidine triad (HIT) family protein